MSSILPKIKKRLSQVLTDFITNEDASIAKHKVVMASGLITGISVFQEGISGDYGCNEHYYGANYLVHEYPVVSGSSPAWMNTKVENTDGCTNNITQLIIKAGHHNTTVCECHTNVADYCQCDGVCGCNDVCTGDCSGNGTSCSLDGCYSDECSADEGNGCEYDDCDCDSQCNCDVESCSGDCSGDGTTCSCESQCICQDDCVCDTVCSCDDVCTCNEN